MHVNFACVNLQYPRVSKHPWVTERQSWVTSRDDSVTLIALEFVFADAVRAIQERRVVWAKFVTEPHSWWKEKTFLDVIQPLFLNILLKHSDSSS